MKLIPLTRGFVALVDDADYRRVMAAGPWQSQITKNTVYAVHSTRKGPVLLHRFIMGVKDSTILVDHQDRIGCNCQRSNLRLATPSQNAANSIKPRRRKEPSSCYKGVSKLRNRWSARIVVDGVDHYIGSFATEQEAAAAYLEKARHYFGQYTRALKLTTQEKRLKGTHQTCRDNVRGLTEIQAEIQDALEGLEMMRGNLTMAAQGIKSKGMYLMSRATNNKGEVFVTEKLNPAFKVQREAMAAMKGLKRALVLLREEEQTALGTQVDDEFKDL